MRIKENKKEQTKKRSVDLHIFFYYIVIVIFIVMKTNTME